MTAKRWLFTVVESLLLAWVLLYLATRLDVPFAREAGGSGQLPGRFSQGAFLLR